MKRMMFILSAILISLIVISGCMQEKTRSDGGLPSDYQTPEPKSTTTTLPAVPASDSMEGFQTFEDAATSISLIYPSDWQKQENVMGTVIMFMSPLKGSSDIFQENLNVIVQDLSSSPMSLEEYSELSIAQVEQLITGVDIIKSEAVILSGEPAKKLVYTGMQGNYNLKWYQVWTIKDNKAYVISFTSEEDRFDDYIGTVDEMVDSFNIG